MSENQEQPRGRQLTDFTEIVGDLNAGVFLQQINIGLSDIAAGVCSTGKNGELTIKLKVQQIGDGAQVKISHSIKAVVPKPRGRHIDEHEVDTPMHVCHGGRLTLYPEQNRFEMGAGVAKGRTDGVRTP